MPPRIAPLLIAQLALLLTSCARGDAPGATSTGGTPAEARGAAPVSRLALETEFPPLASPWALSGRTPGLYRMAALGSVNDSTGAKISTSSNAGAAADTASASISVTVPASQARGHDVRMIADIDTRDARGGVSLWMRAKGGTRILGLVDGSGVPATGTGSIHREITMTVPDNADSLVLGVLQSGSGQATLRSVKLVVAPLVVRSTRAVSGQEEIDSAIAIVRQFSLWRDTVSWDAVLPTARAWAGSQRNSQNTYPAIRDLLRRLGDHHSALIEPAGVHTLVSGQLPNQPATVRALPGAVGYIAVPAYAGSDSEAAVAYTRATHAALAGIAAPSTCGWVVDLRGNGGGNMFPMLAGLQPFLGTAGLGSFVGPMGSSPLWHAGQDVGISAPASLAPLESSNVAVLIGPRTASSGEAVAISFIGRPGTRSFGLPTAGLSTANKDYPLPDGARIVLTNAVDADRSGRRYGGSINPDEVVPMQGGTGDAQLARATEWLSAQPGCRR